MKIINTRVIFFCLLLVNMLYSQDRRFHHITSKDGLSQSEVYCFLKDSRGFMWFGTVDGLNRYDGYSIKIFNTQRNNIESLSNNTVRSIVEDTMGRIWIGTDDGLNMYNPKTEKIRQIIPVSISSQKLNISTILLYNEYLYLGTGKGLFRIKLKNDYSKEESVFLEKIDVDIIKKESNINIVKLKKSSLGGFWVQTSSTVSRIIIESNSNKAVNVEVAITNTPYSFFDIIEDDSENLWITCNGNGLLRHNLKTKEKTLFTYELPSLKCSSITLDLEGNIWVGTLDSGLVLLSSNQKNNKDIVFKQIQQNPYNPSSINSNLIRTLYMSNDNILWIGTIGSGINYYDAEQKNFKHLRVNTSTSNGSNFIRAVFLTNENNLCSTICLKNNPGKVVPLCFKRNRGSNTEQS